MLEKDFEDILSRYPELIEDGLTLKGRQVTIHGRRMDMVFVDKFDRTLIVELKSGPIKDKDIGQIMSYEGMMLSSDDPTVRIMLIGTRVPPNIKRVLDHHGIAFLEIKHSTVLEHLRVKGDKDLLSVVAEEQPIAKFKERALAPPPALTKRAGLPDKISTVLCNQGSSFPEGYSEKLTIEEVRCLFGHLYINDINQKKKYLEKARQFKVWANYIAALILDREGRRGESDEVWFEPRDIKTKLSEIMPYHFDKPGAKMGGLLTADVKVGSKYNLGLPVIENRHGTRFYKFIGLRD